MKEIIFAQNCINRIVDETILALYESYNIDWNDISKEKYINLFQDRMNKQIKQMRKEWK